VCVGFWKIGKGGLSANLWSFQNEIGGSKKISSDEPAKKKELLCFVPKASYFFYDRTP
jgi:hypothetical protein